jgi:hypothetical protein
MKKPAILFVATLASFGGAWAQNAPPKPDPREFLRFDFVLKETENGKVVNSRTFQMMTATDEQAMSSIRSGDKIPVPAVGVGGNTIYIDVGVNLDVRRVHRINDELTMELVAEASSADPGTNVIRQVKWNSSIQIPIRKPVVIFSSDGPTAKRQMQLEITATPIH